MSNNVIRGYILYDDACGFCRRWIPFWSATLSRRGMAIAPLQAEWVRQWLKLPDEELLDDLRLLLVDGRQVKGADVYRYVLRRIWWAYPLYIFSIIPWGRQMFDWGYRTFARNRHLVSRTCGLRAGLADAARNEPGPSVSFSSAPKASNR
ncbi:MAG: DCC1-like thiol-disulfide oxidoreductase family protein [Planctomycetaceae bacterium]